MLPCFLFVLWLTKYQNHGITLTDKSFGGIQMWMLDNPNTSKIKELVYRGIMCKAEENKGWKIVLGDAEYLFPNLQQAKFAIDRIHQDCGYWYGGEKIK